MYRTTLLGLIALGLLAAPANAQVIVTVQDATINEGQTGYVDVLISSTTNAPLSLFGFEFRIAGTTANRLLFVNPQPTAYLTDPNYVLFGDSLIEMSNLPVGNVTQTTVPDDTFIGGDYSNTFSDVILPVTPKLLARLQITAATVLPPLGGETYTLSLILNNPPPGPPNNSYYTFFQDSLFNEIPLDPSSRLQGTITVQSVPEPGTWALSAVALAAGGLVTWRRRS
ncbi:MAG: PEP-CTERM sorting domain-containing protein [Isosphaeraceae bacterium]